MAKKDLQYGVTTIYRMLRELKEPEELANLYAEAVLTQAVRNAQGRPTPQAVMAARNLKVEGATIGPRAGGTPAEVAIGSEFGSNLYRQFQKPPNPRGYWLYPAAVATSTIAAGEAALEDVLKAVIDGR